jgi:hypothetical protein
MIIPTANAEHSDVYSTIRFSSLRSALLIAQEAQEPLDVENTDDDYFPPALMSLSDSATTMPYDPTATLRPSTGAP